MILNAKKMATRIIAMILALLMCASSGVVSAFAGELEVQNEETTTEELNQERESETTEESTQEIESTTVTEATAPQAAEQTLSTFGADLVISTAEELYNFAVDVNEGNDYANKTIQLTADVDISAYKEWPGIGGYGGAVGYVSRPFSGEFDGGGHKISGLQGIDNGTHTYGFGRYGLFGYVVGGSIHDVNVELGGNLTADYDIGALAGVVTDGAYIYNCNVSGNGHTVKATGGGRSGGLIGWINLDVAANKQVVIENCHVSNLAADGDYTSTSGNYAAGFVGVSYNGKLINCTVNGTSSESYSYAGGFAGAIHGSSVLENCYVTDATATSRAAYAGGFAGTIYGNTTVSNCYSAGCTAKTTTSYIAGGFVGEVVQATVRNCYAQTDVTTATTSAGGFVGYLSASGSALIENCYATGSVTGTYYVGGFAGEQHGSGTRINNSYATGTVKATTTNTTLATFQGGFIGYPVAGYQNNANCFYDSTMTGQTKGLGGDSGNTYATTYTTTEMTKASSFASWSITNNLDGAANGSGSDLSPWYIDDECTYPYLYYQYEGHSEADTNYDLGAVNYQDNSAVGIRKDFALSNTVPFKVTSAGADKAYFPYTGTSRYDVNTSAATDVPSNSFSDSWSLYSLGGVSKTNIIGFENGVTVKKNSNSATLNSDGNVYVGDTITYTVTVKNNRIEIAGKDNTVYNAVITDNLPIGLTLVDGTVKIDGVTATAGTGSGQYSISAQTLNVYLGNIAPEQQKIVTFDAYIGADASGNRIENTGVVAYTLDEENAELSFVDEDAFTVLPAPAFKADKSSDRSTTEKTTVEDIVKYTITARNEGTATAYDVQIFDNLVKGVDLINNSVTIDGLNTTNYTLGAADADGNRVLSINVGNLDAGKTVEVTFQVTITEDAVGKSIENTGTVTGYKDQNHGNDDKPDVEEEFSDGNTGEVIDKNVEIDGNITKSSDVKTIQPGGTYTYTVRVENTTNVNWTNVKVTDTLPSQIESGVPIIEANSEIRLVSNSNGVIVLDFGTIAAGEYKEVQISVKVKADAQPGEVITNKVVVDITDERDNEKELGGEDKDGPKIVTIGLKVVKTSDRIGTTRVGDVVTYKIAITNTGSTTAYDVKVNDILVDGVELVDGTVKLDGIATSNHSFSGDKLIIEVGDINSGDTVEVTFDVEVTEKALGNSIENIGTVTGYGEPEDEREPDDVPDIEEEFSDENKDLVDDKGDPNLVAKKTSNRGEPTRTGDTVSYEIIVTNTGVAKTAYDTTIYDTIATGVTLVENSVKVNNQTATYSMNGNNVLVIDIGDLAPNVSVTVTFDVEVTDKAIGNSIENVGTVTAYTESKDTRDPDAETDVETGFTDNNTNPVEDEAHVNLNAVKKNDRGETTHVGDTIIYTITVTNDGNITAYDVEVNDTLAEGIEFVSAKLNGTEVNGVAPVNGVITIGVGNLKANGGSAEVTIAVKVTEAASGKTIENIGTVTGYTDPKDEREPGTDPEEKEFTDGDKDPVEKEYVKLDAVKENDRGETTRVGDTIIYTIKVTNNGNITAYDVEVNDTLAEGIEFVSAKLNGAKQNVIPINSVVTVGVGDLAVGAFAEVIIEVKVTEAASGKTIENLGTVTGYSEPEDEREPGTAPEEKEFTDGDKDPVKDDTKPTLLVKKESNRGEVTREGDTIEYTITAENTGTVPAYDVVVYDNIAEGVELVSGSVKVNGNTTAYSLENGLLTVNVGNLAAGVKVIVAFQMKVTTDAIGKDIENTGKVTGYSESSDDRESGTKPDVEETFSDNNNDIVQIGLITDHVAYIVGYGDGTVRPEANISRAETTTIFFRLLTNDSRSLNWSQINDYPDVESDKWYNNAISTMTKAGKIEGYDDGTFNPTGNITRAEFTVIISRFVDADPNSYAGEDKFSDISGHYARNYINIAAEYGLIEGDVDSTRFRPDDYITRAEAMTIVNRLLGRDHIAEMHNDMVVWSDNTNTTIWYYTAVQEATNSHEYDVDADGNEHWTNITENPDWERLEREWSTANS